MEYYTKYGFCVKSRMAGLLVGFFVFDPQITQITLIGVAENIG